jgi:hypothetical protein
VHHGKRLRVVSVELHVVRRSGDIKPRSRSSYRELQRLGVLANQEGGEQNPALWSVIHFGVAMH